MFGTALNNTQLTHQLTSDINDSSTNRLTGPKFFHC